MNRNEMEKKSVKYFERIRLSSKRTVESMLSAFAVFLYVKMIDPFWQWWEIVTITKFTDFCVHACVCVFLTINSSAVHNDTSYQFVPSQKSARIHFFIVNFVSFLLMCEPARTRNKPVPILDIIKLLSSVKRQLIVKKVAISFYIEKITLLHWPTHTHTNTHTISRMQCYWLSFFFNWISRKHNLASKTVDLQL